MSPASNAAHMPDMTDLSDSGDLVNPGGPAHRHAAVQSPRPPGIAVDETLMTTTRLVLALHPAPARASTVDTAMDATAVYGWLTEQTRDDPVTRLRVYPTPAETAAWLHDLRRHENRGQPCSTCGTRADSLDGLDGLDGTA